MLHRPCHASSTPFGPVLQPRLGNQVVVVHHSDFVYLEGAAETWSCDVLADALGRRDSTLVVAGPTAAVVPALAGRSG